MKNEVAITENIKKVDAMLDDLINRPMGVEGMGAAWGYAGEGKTTTIAWVANQVDGVCFRAMRGWTPLAMLKRFAKELGLKEVKGSKSVICDRIIADLMANPRVVIIDEADRFFLERSKEMIETLRDIYDVSQSPIILFGEEGMATDIKELNHLRRRIQKWVEFKPLEFKDVKILTDTVCEVPIEHDLLAELNKKAKGNIGLITLGLEKIEKFSKRNNIAPDPIGVEQWGNREFFLTSKHGGLG